MYSFAKETVTLRNTAIAFSLFCATAAQANVFAEPEAQLQVSSPAATPVLLAETRVPAPQWLLSSHRITTLRLTQAGLAPLGLDRFAHAAASNIAPERAPLSGFAALAPRDRITTASIPVPAPRPATRAARQDTSYQATSQAVSRTIRQDRPLFGAHRIRFGKIGSGARISGLIRKAASTGASAICINSCADLADRLDLGGADITDRPHTCARRDPVQMNRAGTAQTLAAAEAGTRQPDGFAQDPEQGRVGFDIHLHRLSIHFECQHGGAPVRCSGRGGSGAGS